MSLPQTLDDSNPDSKAKARDGPDVTDLARLLAPVNIRSIALTGMFILAVFYTLKIASSFFIPVVLAILLNFVFASTIRTLGRFAIPAPVGAVLVLGLLIGGRRFRYFPAGRPRPGLDGKTAGDSEADRAQTQRPETIGPGSYQSQGKKSTS